MSLLRVFLHVLSFLAALSIGIGLMGRYGLAAGVFASSVILLLHDIADTLLLIKVELSREVRDE
jgi:hypothetical protein